jgi:hypothetical protein
MVSFLTAMLLSAGLAAPRPAAAHCDTMDGPVVADARLALEKGDVTPSLKWVRASDEAEIRTAFQRTLAVRGLNPDARALADQYFFETLVRVHRAGEGAAYNGLKPAGAAIEPAVATADEALRSGAADGLVHLVTEAVAAGIRERFEHAFEARKHAGESVEAGREFVARYVEFTHYVERLHLAAGGAGGDHADASAGGEEAHAQHHD